MQNVQKIGENRLTWQPERGVREAIVVVPYANGYVLVGRSLKEIEKREKILTVYIGIAWVLSLVGSLFFVAFFAFLEFIGKKK